MKRISADLGASGTRVADLSKQIFELPNDIYTIDKSEVVDIAVTTTGDKAKDFVENIDIFIEKTAGDACKHFPVRALVGPLAERFATTPTRPSVMTNKSGQRVNFVNAIVSMTHQLYVHGYDGSDVTMYIALPPLEVTRETKDKMQSQLGGTYHISLGRLGWEANVNVTKVVCLPECYMAASSFFFDFPTCKKNEIRIKEYGKSYVLCLDIGASTTDVYVIKDGKPIEKSGQTFKTGCNVIEMDIANGIRTRYGFDAQPEVLQFVMKEGRLPMGKAYADVSDILRKAKQKFARDIVAQLQDYFRLTGIQLYQVTAILVAGGGALASGYLEESGPVTMCECVGEYIIKQLKDIIDENAKIDVITLDNPREANIIGLIIYMMMEEAKEALLAANAAANTTQA